MSAYRDFTGSEYVTLANEPTFDFERTQPFSAACWVWWDTNALGASLITKQENAGSVVGWGLYTETFTGPDIAVNLRNGAGNEIVKLRAAALGAMALSTWHCVGFTYNGTSTAAGVKIYLAGAEVASYDTNSDTLTGTILNAIPARIGARGTAPGEFLGDNRVAFPAIWNTNLTAANMAAYFAGGTIPRRDALVAFLPLQTNSSTEPDDWSTNDGTVTTAAHNATGGPSVAYSTLDPPSYLTHSKPLIRAGVAA